MRDRARNTAPIAANTLNRPISAMPHFFMCPPPKGREHTRSACNPAMNPAQMQQGGSDLNGRMDSQRKAGLRRLNRSLKRV